MTSPPTLNVPKDTLSSINIGARVVVQRYEENESIHAECATSPQDCNFNPNLIIEDIALSSPIIVPEPVHEARVYNASHQNVGKESINCAVCRIDATTKEHTLRCTNSKNLFQKRCIKMQYKEYREII